MVTTFELTREAPWMRTLRSVVWIGLWTLLCRYVLRRVLELATVDRQAVAEVGGDGGSPAAG